MKQGGYLKRYTPPRKAKTGFKKSGSTPKRSQKPQNRSGRTKLPKVSTMRNKCDALLTPIIKAMYPKCLLTGRPTEVAHHHVHKSQSSALRYYIPNLIPLTHKAHQALHHNESYYASKIISIKGIEWFQDLEKKKNEYTKTDVHFYIANYERLQILLRSLQ